MTGTALVSEAVTVDNATNSDGVILTGIQGNITNYGDYIHSQNTFKNGFYMLVKFQISTNFEILDSLEDCSCY